MLGGATWDRKAIKPVAPRVMRLVEWGFTPMNDTQKGGLWTAFKSVAVTLSRIICVIPLMSFLVRNNPVF